MKTKLDFPVAVGDHCAYVKNLRKGSPRRQITSNELFCIVPANGNARQELMRVLGKHQFTCNFKEMKRYPYPTYIFAVPGKKMGVYSFDRPRVCNILKVDKRKMPLQMSLFDLTKKVGPAPTPAPNPPAADDMPLPQKKRNCPKQFHQEFSMGANPMQAAIDELGAALKKADSSRNGTQHGGRHDNLCITCIHKPEGVQILVNGCVYKGFMSVLTDPGTGKPSVTTIILNHELAPATTTAP